MYGEKLISVEAPPSEDGTTSKIEYRVWNPFRSKLAAAILGGVDGIHIVPGAKVRKIKHSRRKSLLTGYSLLRLQRA